ncbi:hypothetical protein Tco_0471731 [Tanacetum coccineum]
MQTKTSSALHNAIMEAGGKDHPPMLAPIPATPESPDAEGSSQPRIDNDIYSTVDAYPNAMEMWRAIERFYKMINELVRNKCEVTNHQVNVQFLLQLKPEWQRFVTLVKQREELKTVSYHKLYDILKQHQNEVNEIRAERLTPATRNKCKAIVNTPPPTYEPESKMVVDDDEMSKEKEIDKLMALISMSFKKIYKSTNNNLRTSSNTRNTNIDNTPRTNIGTGYDRQFV